MRARLLSCTLSLVFAASSVAQAPVVVDGSESGALFAFDVAPAEDGDSWLVGVRADPAFAWDAWVFEVRGVSEGQRVAFQVETLGQVLSPAVSIGVVGGEFRWESVATTTCDGSVCFELPAPRERFLVRLRPDPNLVSEAPYYSWDRFVMYVGELMSEPDVAITQIGSSVQGRPLARFVIDVPSSKPKKTVLMGVRQHGDEFGSSYLLEGAVDLLLGRNGLTPEPHLLEDIRWIIYPLMNPDGAVANVRWNSRGVDLNRDWDRNGANAASQEAETFALQSDVETFEALYGFDVGGDHHGWFSAPDGGFRYAQGQSVSNVSAPQYQEARKDTEMYTLYDPSQINWIENGGTTGMLRSEMFLRFGFLLHTPEYASAITTEPALYAKGQAWVRAMHDTLFAPVITDATGAPLPFLRSAGDMLHVTVDDLDENLNASATEFVFVTVTDLATGDSETLELAELGLDSGVFRNPLALPVVAGTATPGNGILETAAGSTVEAAYTDDDFPRDSSTTTVPVKGSPFLPDVRPQAVPR